MLTTLTVVWRVVFAPVWLLWTLYKGLWWAFDDSDARRAAGSASIAPPDAPPPPSSRTDAPRFPSVQATAFEITDSTPRAKKPPLAALRGGFMVAFVVSGVLGMVAAGIAGGEGGSVMWAWMVWGWGTLVAAVGTLYVVRHVARRQEIAEARSVWGRCRLVAGGVKDACVEGGRGVASAGRAAGRAAAFTREKATVAATSAPARGLAKAARWTWTSVRGLRSAKGGAETPSNAAAS